MQPYIMFEEASLTHACQAINSKLHAETNRIIELNTTGQQNINVQAFMDPIVWKAMCILTQTSPKKSGYIRSIRTVFASLCIYY